jgi:(E)-4-hydroxy-3-methylbut-2-enyl-diphosphate synthase
MGQNGRGSERTGTRDKGGVSKKSELQVKDINYQRRKTIAVDIGHVPVGSDFPIRVQSMANTQTSDVEGSVEQCIRISEKGADYVRFTVPSVSDIQSIDRIRKKIRGKGYLTPVIADVHYSADIALKVAEVVDKVRINPGNFAGRADPERKGKGEEIYKQGLGELKKKLIPLVDKCRRLGVALRIGVNHGSLSGRIMDRYGDTPAGMAESALEMLRICKEEDFNQAVVSMKASNVRIMVQATRLAAKMMDDEGLHFPLHLGVTEAGEGIDGRIKSAAGIGALLNDGLGDTIRISLTEDPELEIPVALKLIRHISRLAMQEPLPDLDRLPANPFDFTRRPTAVTGNMGGHHVPVVIGEAAGADYLFSESGKDLEKYPRGSFFVMPYREWLQNRREDTFPLMSADQYLVYKPEQVEIIFVQIGFTDLKRREQIPFGQDTRVVLVYACSFIHIQTELRLFYRYLQLAGCNRPVVIRVHYRENDPETLQIISASDVGGTFIDGFGDGLWISNQGPISRESLVSLSFGILQSCRARITHTDYISCPSCGRTNFNLAKTLSRIKAATSHLKTLKIGVMGCVVNGPGEMADADYGYVGSGAGKVTLYKSKQIIKRGIPEDSAVDELIALIRENGDWTEP